jgi:hypothetical protein
MSPLIRRLLVDEPECSAGKIEHAHEFYVPRAELRPGDVVLDPAVTDRNSPKYIRPEVLAGLAAQFPKEFAAASEKRGVTPDAAGDGDGGEGGEGDDGATPLALAAKKAAAIVRMGAEKAVAAISAETDPDILAAVRELEEEGRKRAPVLEAITKQEAGG